MASVSLPWGRSDRSLAAAIVWVMIMLKTSLCLRRSQCSGCCVALRLDHSGVNFVCDQPDHAARVRLLGALPFRLTPRLPELRFQSRHLASLANGPSWRIPPSIPSSCVLLPMCRSSRYEGPRAATTSPGGQVAGLIGRRGGLLRVVHRVVGCGARCGVRSATVCGLLWLSRVI